MECNVRAQRELETCLMKFSRLSFVDQKRFVNVLSTEN